MDQHDAPLLREGPDEIVEIAKRVPVTAKHQRHVDRPVATSLPPVHQEMHLQGLYWAGATVELFNESIASEKPPWWANRILERVGKRNQDAIFLFDEKQLVITIAPQPRRGKPLQGTHVGASCLRLRSPPSTVVLCAHVSVISVDFPDQNL